MRRSVHTLLLVLLLLPSAPAGASPAVQVVSLLGSASANGKPLVADQALAAGTEVDVAAGAVLQLLVDRARLAASVCGRGQVGLLASTADVAVKGEPTLRLAGVGILATDELSVEVWGTVMLERGRLYVLAGRATVSTAADRPVKVRAGEVARALPGGGLRVSPGAPDEDASRETARHAAPAPWDPEVTRVDLSVVRKARQQVQQQQQRDRELASCGCTEGSGPGAGPVQGNDVEHRVEGRQTTIRVRVQGLPKRIH